MRRDVAPADPAIVGDVTSPTFVQAKRATPIYKFKFKAYVFYLVMIKYLVLSCMVYLKLHLGTATMLRAR